MVAQCFVLPGLAGPHEKKKKLYSVSVHVGLDARAQKKGVSAIG